MSENASKATSKRKRESKRGELGDWEQQDLGLDLSLDADISWKGPRHDAERAGGDGLLIDERQLLKSFEAEGMSAEMAQGLYDTFARETDDTSEEIPSGGGLGENASLNVGTADELLEEMWQDYRQELEETGKLHNAMRGDDDMTNTDTEVATKAIGAAETVGAAETMREKIRAETEAVGEAVNALLAADVVDVEAMARRVRAIMKQDQAQAMTKQPPVTGEMGAEAKAETAMESGEAVSVAERRCGDRGVFGLEWYIRAGVVPERLSLWFIYDKEENRHWVNPRSATGGKSHWLTKKAAQDVFRNTEGVALSAQDRYRVVEVGYRLDVGSEGEGGI